MRLSLLSLLLTTLFAGLALLAASIGTLQQPHATLSEFEGCSLPCWQGIVPGVTDRYEASSILMQNGYRVRDDKFQPYIIIYRAPGGRLLCEISMFYREELVDLVEMKSCGDMYLGDLMTVLGSPEGIFFGRNRGVLSYAGDSVRVTSFSWTTPFSLVSSVIIYRQDNQAHIWPWHGFLPRWRYCQLESVCFR
jgi:hypothetical protein